MWRRRSGWCWPGLERREQKVSATTAYAVTQRTINAVFGGINGNYGAHSWQFNLRRDSNSQFGDSDTGFVGYGFRITPAWRVHASHGTSFVAPSFNQLYFPGFGNPALQPERGKNTDVGVTWAANGQEVKLVRYDNKIRGFMTNTTLPVNIPRARIDGWTLGYEGAFDALALRASVDVLDPRNELNGRQLPRRAKQQLTAGADYTMGAWRFGGSRAPRRRPLRRRREHLAAARLYDGRCLRRLAIRERLERAGQAQQRDRPHLRDRLRLQPGRAQFLPDAALATEVS